MKGPNARELSRRFARQHGVIGRNELNALGFDSRIAQRRVAAGEWQAMGKRVIRLAAAPMTSEQALLAACIEAGPGAVASHQSAAWLWELSPAPDRHSVTIPRSMNARVDWADVHRTQDLIADPIARRGIPVTNPLRTLVDLASVTTGLELDAAIDRALARQLVTVEGILAEVDRLGRRGRGGVGIMRNALRRRGMLGVPSPSVLESRMLSLLRRHRIPVLGTEVWIGQGGLYRVDTALTDRVLAEVDGYAHHHSPEQKTEDERRRNRIRLSGRFVLVYTWRDIVYDGARVVAEIRRAMKQQSTTQLAGSARRPPVL